MVEWWSIKHKVVGSTPPQVNFCWLFLNFFHTFIKFNIYKVSSAVVEACLNNSSLQYRTVPRDPMMQCHPVIWTHALVRPNQKLNWVWCTVELKVIGNLECRIKFYRGKKPRHFFYTIEYPYPPTNSVGACPWRLSLAVILAGSGFPHVANPPNTLARHWLGWGVTSGVRFGLAHYSNGLLFYDDFSKVTCDLALFMVLLMYFGTLGDG
jgi:hypothetical protein